MLHRELSRKSSLKTVPQCNSKNTGPVPSAASKWPKFPVDTQEQQTWKNPKLSKPARGQTLPLHYQECIKDFLSQHIELQMLKQCKPSKFFTLTVLTLLERSSILSDSLPIDMRISPCCCRVSAISTGTMASLAVGCAGGGGGGGTEYGGVINCGWGPIMGYPMLLGAGG